jgi:CheY-like chemotaxis protein
MSKILLVEDDNNLREIYEARLQAEGYEIVSARDGEEALTVAMKERPDLIISDVMMPKISGFDMLDIIRSTEETKNVKVIMMTALSQAEDKERAAKLGADRYLVKSQVTLEDVAKVAREVLADDSDSSSRMQIDTAVPTPPLVAQTTVPAPAMPVPTTTTPTVPVVEEPVTAPAAVQMPVPQPADPVTATPIANPVVVSEPVAQTPDPAASSSPAMSAISPAPVASVDEIMGVSTNATEKSVEDEQSAIAAQIESFIEVKKTDTATPTAPASPSVASGPEPLSDTPPTEAVPASSTPVTDASEPTKKKIIQPISDPTASKGPDLDNLLKKEVEKEQMAEIAKTYASQKVTEVDELAAESALKNAAKVPLSETATETNDDTPQVTITENGDLQVKTAPSESATTETPSAPIIPHSNGSSIDGVVQQTSTLTAPQQTPDPAPASDPNAIAL